MDKINTKLSMKDADQGLYIKPVRGGIASFSQHTEKVTQNAK